ncbi:MAG TPA: hypothetical protein VN782_03980 [Usitatibacter sp.]|nr:hypothetical protein [Usitatibacter sp.]
MNPTTFPIALAAVAFAAAAGYGVQSAMSAPPTLMSPSDHDQAWRSIEQATRAALGRCRTASESLREACRASVRAQDRVQKAELDARYFGTVQAEAHAQEVRAHARFDITRAECEARGSDRASCLAEARTAQAKALALSQVASS